MYPTYSGISNKEVERNSSVLDIFQRKQLVTVRMNQIQSQLVLGTKTVLSSDHVHTANLRWTLHDIGDSRLVTFTFGTPRIRRSRMTQEPEGSECSAKARRRYESPSRWLKNDGEKKFRSLSTASILELMLLLVHLELAVHPSTKVPREPILTTGK